MKHGFETKVAFHLSFLVSMPVMLDFGVINVWYG
jgi:undecaprenyl pyrophosphate phosphatase UppP